MHDGGYCVLLIQRHQVVKILAHSHATTLSSSHYSSQLPFFQGNTFHSSNASECKFLRKVALIPRRRRSKVRNGTSVSRLAIRAQQEANKNLTQEEKQALRRAKKAAKAASVQAKKAEKEQQEAVTGSLRQSH